MTLGFWFVSRIPMFSAGRRFFRNETKKMPTTKRREGDKNLGGICYFWKGMRKKDERICFFLVVEKIARKRCKNVGREQHTPTDH
jgi:hypothetical protein